MWVQNKLLHLWYVRFTFIHNLCSYWLIWFINQRALCNHALSVVIGIGVVGIGICIVCAHLALAHG